jgi:hypothetical protein
MILESCKSICLWQRIQSINVLLSRYPEVLGRIVLDGSIIDIIEAVGMRDAQATSPSLKLLTHCALSIWTEATPVPLSLTYRLLDSVDFEAFMITLQMLWSDPDQIQCNYLKCQNGCKFTGIANGP